MSQEHAQSLPGNFPDSGLQSTQPLWTDSTLLGGYFVYAPSTDEIYLRDGRHFPRPENLPRSALAIATYTGRLPPPIGLPRLPLPHDEALTSTKRTDMQLSTTQNAGGAMERVGLARQSQHTTAQRPHEVVRSGPPWKNSPGLGGYYVYVPSTDEIYLRNGSHFSRPAHILRTSPALTTATYTGTLPPPGLPQHPLPVTESPPTPMQVPIHLGSPQNFVGAMGSMNHNRGPTQHITAQKPVEVVFHQGSTQPNLRARGVNISKSEITSTLFKEYKVRNTPKQFFQVGKVFLVLWSEPAGGTSLVSKWASGTVINHLGERVFSKVRRFVVIREGSSYCNALPINTYAGRGVAKPGVNKSEHVIIFTGNSPPPAMAQEQPKAGEFGMQPVSILVDAESPAERLDPMSRLDLGGVTKVEHNIKVKSLGNVNKRSLDALRTQYARVQGYESGVRTPTFPKQYGLHSSPQKLVDGLETRKVEEEEDDEENSEDEGDDDDDDESNDDGGSDDSVESPDSTVEKKDVSAAAGPSTHTGAARPKTGHSLPGNGRGEDNKYQAKSDDIDSPISTLGRPNVLATTETPTHNGSSISRTRSPLLDKSGEEGSMARDGSDDGFEKIDRADGHKCP